MTQQLSPVAAPLTQLFELTMQMRRMETTLRQARTIRRVGRAAATVGPALLLGSIISGMLSRGIIDIGGWVILGVLTSLATIAVGATYIHADFFNKPILDIDTVEVAELKLGAIQEQRRRQLALMGLDVNYRRTIYREQLQSDIEGFRKGSRRYRRVHNIMQSIIIVFSLVNSTVTGIALDGSHWQWPAVGGSFAVGLSAGFMGYFKYRERGFYLQQTADAIQYELDSAELGIFRYANQDGPDIMLLLVEEVERLKAEQRKREQSLDQPSDGRRDQSGAA
ncbi:SLATT domain-containing protein [Catellatospora sp. NPDC049111]|uniref:SLATT domain-containing protein n=1 Tax=Catellatospora sp. NPDC049111 TaxID=3155271 RepID=UPI0034082C3B